MFDFIQGKKEYLDPISVVVTSPFYGWRVFITKDSYDSFSQQEDIRVFLYTQIINDTIIYYGFSSEVERAFFKLLIGVSGIGPRLAIRSLAHTSYQEIYRAIAESDAKKIGALPGIGPKTAQKLILELQDKIKHLSVDVSDIAVSSVFSDAFMALENFGFDSSKIRSALKDMKSLKQDWILSDLIKNLLQILNKK